jgi:OmpA-OmpF porin, OOP family
MSMKRALVAAAAIMALPVVAHAQSPAAGFYGGVEGGLAWLLNTTIAGQNVIPATGWAAGGKFGYDFIGPRVEVEGLYHENQTAGANFPGAALNGKIGQADVMANILYDFNAGGVIVPFIGAGAGVGFIDSQLPIHSTQFAYQGILGVGWNATPNLRLDLDGRYWGTTNPTFNGSSWNNNSFGVMLGVTFKFGAPVEAAPPPPPAPSAPSFMVFFDWDRSNLSPQALTTIQQAADAYKAKGNARITATGHTDTSGPEAYNMALSLRRANAVKDALVRDGVPATAISVVGRGKHDLLVPTADGVREPQNRRVEIVIQ